MGQSQTDPLPRLPQDRSALAEAIFNGPPVRYELAEVAYEDTHARSEAVKVACENTRDQSEPIEVPGKAYARYREPAWSHEPLSHVQCASIEVTGRFDGDAARDLLTERIILAHARAHHAEPSPESSPILQPETRGGMIFRLHWTAELIARVRELNPNVAAVGRHCTRHGMAERVRENDRLA